MPTHLFAKDIEDRIEVPIADIRRVVSGPGLFSGKLRVEVEGVGEVNIPVGTSDEAMRALIDAWAVPANRAADRIEHQNIVRITHS